MAWDIVDRFKVHGKSFFEKPDEMQKIYCETENDIKDLPKFPEIKVGSEAVVVNNDHPLKVYILMRTGLKGPF